MREELFGPKVENVVVAVAQQFNEENHPEYYVYLMNLRDDIMEGIIITSTGYGENANTGEKIKTSTLRHCIELLLPNEAAKSIAFTVHPSCLFTCSHLTRSK